MTITVGTDSYISVAEANAYISTNTLSNASWSAISNSTKEVLLRMATRAIDTFPFIGDKFNLNQDLEFPRLYERLYYSAETLREMVDVAIDTPQEIKDACAEEALAIYLNQNNKINQFKDAGIKSMSLGNESYTFVNGASNAKSLLSPVANNLIAKWTRKGFKIC